MERYTETVGEGQRVALAGVAISASLALIKIVTGVLSGSSALLADGCEAGGDILASGLVWLGLKFAEKPADWNHPYGHGRAETLSGLIVGILLFGGGLAIAIESALTARGVTSQPATYAIWPLILSVIIKIGIARVKLSTGRRIGSVALTADAMNDAVDIVSGVIALSALALTLYDPDHFLRADKYGACAVGLIMIGTGVRIARRTGIDLMDTMPDDGLLERIREVAREVPGVDAVEKVFARKTGLRHHVELHLEVNPDMTVRDSHELGHLVERRLLESINGVADVLVHVEPTGGLKRGLVQPKRF
jgi:cation diffusion facilitator family transporter